MPAPPASKVFPVWARRTVELALLLLAILLCWADVRWALRPGLFLMLDELSNPAQFLNGTYSQIVHVFPEWFFGDRAIGWAFIRLINDWFGFNYTRQLECLLAIHFANCAMALALYRRLGASVPVSIAGLALFGSLWTTANTATYPGEAPDVLCLFFLLASTLVLLSERRGANIVSAILYFAALRTKEFGIVAPIPFTVLVALQLPRQPLRPTVAALLRRLWLHYTVLLVIGLRYFQLYLSYRTSTPAGNPYRVHPGIAAAAKNLAWFTGQIFGRDYTNSTIPALAVVLVLAAIFAWAVYRRNSGLAFGIAAFVFTLLPVCVIEHRADFYVYAPQVFLILALCLLADGAIALCVRGNQARWIAAVCLVLLCFAGCLDFRRSSYFRDRINWTFWIRGTCRRTAHDVDTKLPPLGPGTRIYVRHNATATPWIFLPPCAYLQMVNRQKGISCFIDKPADQVRAVYDADAGPKFLLDYHDNGTFDVLDASRTTAAANR